MKQSLALDTIIELCCWITNTSFLWAKSIGWFACSTNSSGWTIYTWCITVFAWSRKGCWSCSKILSRITVASFLNCVESEVGKTISAVTSYVFSPRTIWRNSNTFSTWVISTIFASTVTNSRVVQCKRCLARSAICCSVEACSTVGCTCNTDISPIIELSSRTCFQGLTDLTCGIVKCFLIASTCSISKVKCR